MKARIRWLTLEEGGRAVLPSGDGPPHYTAPMEFANSNAERPASDTWSLVVEKIELAAPREWIAEVRFLVPEAPADQLTSGIAFALYEGSRRVAVGRVA